MISPPDDDAGDSTATLVPAAARNTPSRASGRSRPPGVLLDRYEVLEEIGHGGMGVVYRARDRQLGRDVAIKLVLTSNEPSDRLAVRLLREAQALAQLSHPNVVAVYDVGRVEGGVFVAMELVAGIAGDVWLQDMRPWRDVPRMFRDAARGLAAAHAVGLVHRDFKPANVIIGSDGRVRVLDFGLARTASLGTSTGELPARGAIDDDAPTVDYLEPETEQLGPSGQPAVQPVPELARSAEREAASPVPSGGVWCGSLLDSPLTQAGALVGTPTYMAPEQHLGTACDARTDQFSFCVAFYRALYGQRPFDGKTYQELKTSILQGTPRPPPPAVVVPGWLHEIVLRGLRVDPRERWPSMGAIIEALGRDPDARRRKLVLAGATALLVAGAGVGTWQALRDPVAACSGGEQDLAGVWDATRKGAVRAAFTRTAKPYAGDAFAAVERTLDGYATRWVTMRTEACRATRVRGTQSPELLDLRMECLQRRLDDVRALVDVFAIADGDVVTRAAQAAGGLPPLHGCADADALRAPVRPPADPQTRARVEAAHRTLAQVRALWVAGRYLDAQRQLVPVVTEARALGWRPLEGEALLAQARLADSTGDYASAAKLYKEAAIAAEAGRDDETAALAQSGLVWVIGERLGRYAEAQELALEASAKIERLGRNELLQADLDQKLAALLLAQGNFKEAEQRSRRVLEIRRRLLAPDDPAIATALGDLGDVAVQTVRYDEAIEHYQRALAVAEPAVGRAHPMCATLRINLGAALRAKGSRAEALAQLEQARVISERALGAEHAQLATIAINIGSILLEEGRDADAATQFGKASEIWTRALGADHPNVATAAYRLGEVALKQGRAAEAATAFQRAFEIWQAKLGAEHPTLAAALAGLGDAARAQQQFAPAVGHYRRALALLEKALGPKDVELAETLLGIGACELALGKPRRALPPLERAVALREQAAVPLELARARFALVHALGTGIDVPRARALATAAQRAFAAAGAAREEQEVAHWLRAHRRRR